MTPKGTQQPEVWLWKRHWYGFSGGECGFPGWPDLGYNAQSITVELCGSYLASLGHLSLCKIEIIIIPQRVILRRT